MSRINKVNRSHLEQILRDTTKPILVLNPTGSRKYSSNSLIRAASDYVEHINWGLSDEESLMPDEIRSIVSKVVRLQFEYAVSIEQVYAKLEEGDYAFVLTGINPEELGVEAAQGYDTRKKFAEELARRQQPFVVNTQNPAINALRNIGKHYMCVTVDGPQNMDQGLNFALGSYARGEALPVDRTEMTYE